MMAIRPGDRVLARSATDEKLERRAYTGIVMGGDFKVVWVCREEEWLKAREEGREPDGVPWPAEDVELASRRDPADSSAASSAEA
jgi:hypothetical protein